MKKCYQQNKQKGFTLVELLIVIVILGVLAALVVPRMLSQANQAITAEAVNMIGTARRGATSFLDTGGPNIPAFNTAVSMAAGSGWAAIGMSALPATRKFDYSSIPASNDIVATRIGGAAGETITINVITGALTCGAAYTPVTDAAGATLRCAA